MAEQALKGAAAAAAEAKAEKALPDVYQASRRDSAKDLAQHAADLKWSHDRRLHLEGCLLASSVARAKV